MKTTPYPILAFALALVCPLHSQDPQTIRVFIQNDHNLQWMNFWIAKGANFFADEGLNIEVVLPGSVRGDGGGGGGRGSGGGGGGGGGRASGGGHSLEDGARALRNGSAQIAVMPRPQFLNAVGSKQPVIAFANLLANDAINLVVQGDIAKERDLSLDLPIAERLKRIRGLKVGVAPGPPPRLRALMQSVGLDADTDIEMMIVPGPAQNHFFGERMVDAIYAHTPYLEKALVDQGGVMIVNQSAGNVKALSNRQIHMLVTLRRYADANPDTIAAATRAIYKAQQLVRSDPEAAAAAIRASGTALKEPHALDTVVEIYKSALPRTPMVSADGALRELELNSAHRELPDMSAIDMNKYVDNRFAQEAVGGE